MSIEEQAKRLRGIMKEKYGLETDAQIADAAEKMEDPFDIFFVPVKEGDNHAV